MAGTYQDTSGHAASAIPTAPAANNATLAMMAKTAGTNAAGLVPNRSAVEVVTVYVYGLVWSCMECESTEDTRCAMQGAPAGAPGRGTVKGVLKMPRACAIAAANALSLRPLVQAPASFGGFARK